MSQTPTGSGFTAVAAGAYHNLALRANGSIVSWGSDGHGLVSQTPAGTGYTAVAAGHGHSLALKADGSIVSWGDDRYGQVSQTPAGTGYTAVAAGSLHSLALRSPAPAADFTANAPSGTAPTVTSGPQTVTTTDTVLKPGSRSYGITPPASGSFARWYTGSTMAGRDHLIDGFSNILCVPRLPPLARTS